MKNFEKVLREEIKKILKESYDESDMFVDDDASAQGSMAPMSLEERVEKLELKVRNLDNRVNNLVGDSF